MMKIARLSSCPPEPARAYASPFRRIKCTTLTVLAAVLWMAALPRSECQLISGPIGPSNGEIVGAAIGIGAAVAGAIITVAVVHSHHVLNGCVVSAANGLELKVNGAQTYLLEADSAMIKAGDRVKIHGSKAKKPTGNIGPVVFKVDKQIKDYGPCSASSADPPGSSH